MQTVKSFLLKSWRSITLPVMVILMAAPVVYGQTEEKESMKHTHRLMLALCHTHFRQGVQDGNTQWLTVPAWSLNYDYWLGNKWAIGLHNDLIMGKFEVKADVGHEETLVRSYPMASAIVGIFKPTRHSAFLLGIGEEFAVEEDLAISRAEYEWSTALSHKWELSFSISYDFRWNAYDSWLLGISISHLFRPVSKMKQ